MHRLCRCACPQILRDAQRHFERETAPRANESSVVSAIAHGTSLGRTRRTTGKTLYLEMTMRTLTFKSTIVATLFAMGGCASTPGAKPQDMSKAQHEQAAAQQDQTAAPHSDAYNPNATALKETCGNPKIPCWTSVVNPTEGHKADAEKHRKMAADHRKAAQALREAEAQSCAGIADADRDMSPFDHREDIVDAKPYNAPTPAAATAKQQSMKLHGAVVNFRAVKGMTSEWLQRVVDCHVARNASMGFDMPEMSYCPLGIKGVRAKVTSIGNGFSITVESDDPAAAQEVLKRAQVLAAK